MILSRKPKVLFPCKDGTYSTHNRRGACNWHEGLKDGAPINLSDKKGKSSGVQMIPLEYIKVDHKLFQNRAQAFSLRSVNNIIKAVQDGSFQWANLDAVTLWRHPKNSSLYILSGHSRHEAFKQLCAARLTAQGKGFCEIPAKVVSVSIEEARKIALESNTLSTKETALERATFYRTQLQGGADAGAVEKTAKRLEGRNWTTIVAFAYLNPSGMTMTALKALYNGQAESKTVITNVARWIGNARKGVLQLTNAHEDELYQWLVNAKGYGTGRGQINSERAFAERLKSIILKRTTFGVLDDRLNIQSAIVRSPIEAQYHQETEDAKAKVNELQKQVNEKIKRLTAANASKADYGRIIEPLERSLTNARIEYQRLISKRADVESAVRNEQTLFGVGYTKRSNSSSIFILFGIAALYYRSNR